MSPVNTVIYLIERTIKTYRKFALKNINILNGDITVDQALILMIISEHPELTQVQIADYLFKDYASITRMIELMVKKDYITRIPNLKDRRRSHLSLSEKGDEALEKLFPIIAENRNTALKGISDEEQSELIKILNKIISNCNSLQSNSKTESHPPILEKL